MGMSKLMRIALLTAIAVALAGCDQVTKSIAQEHLQLGEVHSYLGDTCRLLLAHNYGAFLNLGASLSEEWRQGLWSIGVGVVLVGMLGYAVFARELDRPTLIALSLIIAGGASNLYDRIVYGGYVIDFLNVGIGWLRTGIFNIADMGITAGALIMLWMAFRGSNRGANPPGNRPAKG
jgi:signal peptidase II